MDSSTSFSVPPPPSLPASGSLPSRRMQTQTIPAEAPACVQNAMMTKDKKPFTYTPGGIDLSQIKSPRMAKRIARNAQYEGVTGQPKPSPLVGNQQDAGSYIPAAPSMAASALGMPVQVFPQGPPPPPPPPSSSGPSTVPPPPPPIMRAQLAPQTNGRDARKSLTPQNFEPPPLGCRPEIKIPPNPMATLKKVPKPEPKNDFWVEEYRKERSKSPMVNESNKENNNEARQEAPRMPSPPKSHIPEEFHDSHKDINRIAFQQQPSPQQSYRPLQSNMPSAQQQMYSPQTDPNRLPQQSQKQIPLRSSSPPKQQLQQQYQPLMQRSVPQQQRQPSPVRTPVGQYQQQRQPPIANPQRVDSPFRSQDNPNLQRPLSPIKVTQPQQQSQPTYYIRKNQQPRQDVSSPPPQQKPVQVGSIYIPPVAPENLASNSNNTGGNQQTPPWLAQRPNMKENPDWIREVNSPPATSRTQTPPIIGNQTGPGLRLQMSSTNAKERIIPIQIEKTPTPSRTPSTPGFGPQPYHANNQQYGSVPSPGSGYSSPGGIAGRNPNQFVEQGYNNYPSNHQQQQRVMSPPVQSGCGRLIPIAVEKQDGPFSPNAVKGPISQTPTVIQNDPRTHQQQQSWSNGAPNQSKSFRILQKITDTDMGKDNDTEQSAELQRPQYSRQMGSANDSAPNDQMRRMQLNDQDQAFIIRAPLQKQTQRYVQQRPVFPQDDQQSQQYIHPSEQQVREPKIYTGSAIPSRSFKILQAMTTPENAVEMEPSRVENEQTPENNYYPYSQRSPTPNNSNDPSYPNFKWYVDNSNECDDFEDTFVETPNIIITSSPEEEDSKDQHDQNDPLDEPNAPMMRESYREGSVFDMLSKRLSEIINFDFEQNISKDDKKYVGDRSKEIQNVNLDITKSSSMYEKSSEIENVSDDESDDFLLSSSSSSEYDEIRKDSKVDDINDGLQVIKSVTNIKVYDTDDEDHVSNVKPKFKSDEHDERHEEESSTESEDYIQQEGIVNSDSDLDEADDLTEDVEYSEIPEELSTIFEEDSEMRPESRKSTASISSECSTTIANDDDDDVDGNTDQEDCDNDDKINLVTVRLPLRLSFSRSSNDENVTTVVVGNSEIDDDNTTGERISTHYHEDKEEEDDDAEEEDCGNDVSVTFSLTSRSNSMDRSGLLSKTSSADHAISAQDWDDSDSEVSVSISLPMKRDKFMAQTLNDDLTNNVHEFKSPWNSGDSEDDDQLDENRKDDDAMIECIPETIFEEDEEDLELKVEREEEVEQVIEEAPNSKIEEMVVEATFKPFSWDIKVYADEEEVTQQNNKEEKAEEEEEEDVQEVQKDGNEREEEEEEDEEEGDSSSESTSSENEKLLKINPSTSEKIASTMELKSLSSLKLLQGSLSFTLEETQRICDETLKNTNSDHHDDDIKVSVRDRIAAFELSPDSIQQSVKPKEVTEIAANNTLAKMEVLSRNSSLQKSESELEEDDSGVTSDMSKPISETDTESECFPELRKMTRYQRAATHSRLFKLLQEESNLEEENIENEDLKQGNESFGLRTRKKIVHNVSITRKCNPDAIQKAETMSQRRERLGLPLKMSNSIDADNLSSSNSPSSPIVSNTNMKTISDQLVNELIQSLLLKTESSHLRNLPIEKLQAAAKKVLQEDLDSLENSSIESTPVLTPQEHNKNEYQKSYVNYYESWNTPDSSAVKTDDIDFDILPSRTFKRLQEQSISGQKKYWSTRCPRVLSSKTVNRDLSRVTESRESESPETYRSPRSSTTPESSREYKRGTSLSQLEK